MLRIALIVFLFGASLGAKEVLIVPYWEGAMHEGIYAPQKNIPFDHLSSYQKLNLLLQKQGDVLRPTDLSSHERLQKARCIIFENTPDWIGKHWQEYLNDIPKKKLILIAYEPPSVKSRMYSKELFSQFHTVLTWNDDLVDNKKFIKFNYPVFRPMIPVLVPFAQKKLLTQICGNKSSSHPDELYSERRKVIDYFEKREIRDFEFYGVGWEKKNLKTWKGVCKDKVNTLKKYRFCICYENTKNQPGYITEKIFDCFAAGCVPIYWGASNVTKYIPRNCFIARQKFKTFDALVRYLKLISEEEFNDYIQNIRTFLQSKEAQQFSQQAFLDVLMKNIQ
jgi:hypothetical protein